MGTVLQALIIIHGLDHRPRVVGKSTSKTGGKNMRAEREEKKENITPTTVNK